MNILSLLIELIPNNLLLHVRSTPLYNVLQESSKLETSSLFGKNMSFNENFPPFGEIKFPYHEMGAVNSLNLFELDELIIFSFYWQNRNIYRNILDVGANIGLHSLLLAKSGYNVRCFEPDPEHFAILSEMLNNNNCVVEKHNAALSTKDDIAEFVRVKGNTTSSHLAGVKSNPYGELERFDVPIKNATPHFEWADLVKLDVEGHEADIICSIEKPVLQNTDIILEVGTYNNAEKIYEYLQSLSGINLFSQKTAWAKILSVEGMPVSYKEGSLFISAKEKMPW